MTATSFVSCLREMMDLQHTHNQQVHPEWHKQDYPFHRAIWTECAELLDHYGWKWWKLQEPDLVQVKLEIVDIWHFGLSMIIVAERNVEELAQEMIAREQDCSVVGPSFVPSVEALAQQALDRQFDTIAFMDMMNALPFPLQDLYGIYKGKNVLNRFRQANGYKDGSYQKMWNGKEDNVHLAELVQSMDPYQSEFLTDLYRSLGNRYRELTNEGKLR
ncbi:MAG: dUTP diphosphatase [Gammaproteobacteria bacterium]|nr:dUTP diphosphatase [Gammaproteobacteria bacterium]MYF38582.1 dUTP diphosphatase [Gammaproteobacteria bacterium]